MSKRGRWFVTSGFIVASGVVLLADFAHERKANEELASWASEVAGNVHPPNPVTFVVHAVAAVHRCFTQPPPAFRATMAPRCELGRRMFAQAAVVGVMSAVDEMPEAGVLGKWTAAIALVMAFLLAMVLSLDDHGVSGALFFVVRLLLIALFGVGPALWLVGVVVRLAAAAAGGIAGLVAFIAVNAFALHVALLFIEAVRHIHERRELGHEDGPAKAGG